MDNAIEYIEHAKALLATCSQIFFEVSPIIMTICQSHVAFTRKQFISAGDNVLKGVKAKGYNNMAAARQSRHPYEMARRIEDHLVRMSRRLRNFDALKKRLAARSFRPIRSAPREDSMEYVMYGPL